MRRSDRDAFGNKHVALRSKYIYAARLFRDLGSPSVREVSHANIVHIILYLHHGVKLELDDDGYAELLTYKGILFFVLHVSLKTPWPPTTMYTVRQKTYILKQPSIEGCHGGKINLHPKA